jgi:hypothetical protein
VEGEIKEGEKMELEGACRAKEGGLCLFLERSWIWSSGCCIIPRR